MRHRTDLRARATRWRRGLAQLPRSADVARFVEELRGPARRSAGRALLDAVVVVVMLERRGVGALFRPVPLGGAGTVRDLERSVRVVAAVDAALGLVPVAPSCLRRSVTLLRELHRLGLDATFHIGVRRDADRLDAHAWVQVGEVVVNDDPGMVQRYVEVAGGELERLFPVPR